ncbi:hypothetical protein Ferp_0532 [Ferroglobus placidus DSM 10642]|uniref:Uncharacterized protein n=1 Tax=Ferroglobus placidus (strain DSM 10642 / AEDII12DO) TaxID=589924 RepID=D3S373_FERPA|nr:hypothetical protein [Ferroglobus placidus]ADC64706.1 hypothetical protein Ferp_0532 [Ferroglobus placidus DSM 10642]
MGKLSKKCPKCGSKEVVTMHPTDGKAVEDLERLSESSYWQDLVYIQCRNCGYYLDSKKPAPASATFCSECFCFGYTKLYQDFVTYSGFDEEVDNSSDLVRVYCPACDGEELVKVDLSTEFSEILSELGDLADEEGISLTQSIEWADDESTAREYSIAALIFTAAGKGIIRTKHHTSTRHVNENTEKARELLEKAIRVDARAVINVVKLLSKTRAWRDAKVRDVAVWVDAVIRNHPEVLADLM